jgi:hypothetical protein
VKADQWASFWITGSGGCCDSVVMAWKPQSVQLLAWISSSRLHHCTLKSWRSLMELSCLESSLRPSDYARPKYLRDLKCYQLFQNSNNTNNTWPDRAPHTELILRKWIKYYQHLNLKFSLNRFLDYLTALFHLQRISVCVCVCIIHIYLYISMIRLFNSAISSTEDIYIYIHIHTYNI